MQYPIGVAKERPPLPTACLNCGTDLSGPFCHVCGQRNRPLRQSIWILVREALEESFELDGRVPRTLVPFVFKPGFLMREYAAGRRVRYSSPLRLFLAFSLIWLSAGWIDRQLDEVDRIRGAQVEAPKSPSLVQIENEPGGGGDVFDLEGDLSENPFARALVKRVEAFSKLDDAAQANVLVKGLFENVPKVSFALVPIFALIMQVLFIGKGRFYLEHLVFGLHLHAYAFLIAAIAIAVPWPAVQILLALTIPVHMFVGLWQGYELRPWPAVARFLLLGWSYSAILALGLAVIVGATIVGS